MTNGSYFQGHFSGLDSGLRTGEVRQGAASFSAEGEVKAGVASLLPCFFGESSSTHHNGGES